MSRHKTSLLAARLLHQCRSATLLGQAEAAPNFLLHGGTTVALPVSVFQMLQSQVPQVSLPPVLVLTVSPQVVHALIERMQ